MTQQESKYVPPAKVLMSTTIQPTDARAGVLINGVPNNTVTLSLDKQNLMNIVSAHIDLCHRKSIPGCGFVAMALSGLATLQCGRYCSNESCSREDAFG